MTIFCLKGYNEEKISLELNSVIGYPDDTSYEGGYDIVCTLTIDTGCYHVEYDRLYSATGALYRFGEELKRCYERLEGTAEYRLLLGNDLRFRVEMTAGGHAIIMGSFQERPDVQNVLEFQMDTDQTCFLSVIKSIEGLKDTYGGVEGV